jgi:queuine tRNA-ribosyltransferase
MSFHFEIVHTSKKSRARVGKIHTPHGIIDTPNFVPVATNGTLKNISSHELAQLNVQLLFCNTYHLILHPGADTVAHAGGLHTFIQRDKPIITDSGGFQVFSLLYGGYTQELKSSGAKSYQSSVLKISDEGVTFRSYRDGSPIILTPESSVKAQKQLGADIIIPLDELPPYHATPHALKRSLDRTHDWQRRSYITHRSDPRQQAMYGVVHGGIDKTLRAHSIQILSQLDFDGMCIGGSIGKDHAEMEDMLRFVLPLMPAHKPIHLLGMGDIPSLDMGISLGIDTFDSAYPTKCARHGMLITSQGTIKIEQGRYKQDLLPVDTHCTCITCARYSRAYLHHLFKAHEAPAHTLAAIHNITYIIEYMRRMREAICEDRV